MNVHRNGATVCKHVCEACYVLCYVEYFSFHIENALSLPGHFASIHNSFKDMHSHMFYKYQNVSCYSMIDTARDCFNNMCERDMARDSRKSNDIHNVSYLQSEQSITPSKSYHNLFIIKVTTNTMNIYRH